MGGIWEERRNSMCKGPGAPGTIVMKLEIREQEGDLGLNKAKEVSMKYSVQCRVSCAQSFGF